jgi:heme iron utilization protein
MPDQVPQKVKKGSVSVQSRLKIFNEIEYFAVLATQGTNTPYTSLVAFVITPDLRRLIFSTTRGTRKYKNILNSERVSLLIDNRSGSNKALMETEAITILGFARPVRRSAFRDECAKIFLAKHPDFESFMRAPTTALIAVEITQCIHVGKFQVVTVWEPVPEKR